MKKLSFLFLIVLLSCTKQTTVITPQKDLYYKIVEYDVDGSSVSSPIRHVGVTNLDGDDDHHPCPIKLETVSITQSGNVVTIYWEAENESSVNHYEVQRSFNSIDWKTISNNNVSGTGKYKVFDNLN